VYATRTRNHEVEERRRRYCAAEDSTQQAPHTHTHTHIVIIIIIIERKDLGGVMSRDCKDTVQKLKTVTERECDAR